MGNESFAVALGAFSSAIGGLMLFVLSGLSRDVREVRDTQRAHGEAISAIKTKVGL